MNATKPTEEMPPLWGGLVAIALMDERHVSSGMGVQGEKADGHLPSEGIDLPVLSLRTKQMKKARRQGSLPYSTLLQRRKRDEVRALQTQARELEARRDELKQRRRDRLDQPPVSIPASPSDGGHQQNWFAVAALRRQERRRSERINHELKAIFQKRLEIHSAFRKILAKKNMLKGMEFVSQLQPLADRALSTLAFSDLMLAGLDRSVEELYLQVDAVIPPLDNSSPSISCRTQNKHTAALGCFVESTTTTSLAWPLDEAARHLWMDTTQQCRDPDKAFRFHRCKNSTSVERNCILTLSDGERKLHVSGTNFVRKFEGTDRIIFAGICSWFLPSEGLRFEIRQWTVISGATTDPLHASVAQCCSQLQAIKSENSSVRARDFDAIQALVLRLVGDKMRRNMETQQNVLLETRSPVVHTQSAIH